MKQHASVRNMGELDYLGTYRIKYLMRHEYLPTLIVQLPLVREHECERFGFGYLTRTTQESVRHTDSSSLVCATQVLIPELTPTSLKDRFELSLTRQIPRFAVYLKRSRSLSE